MHVTLHGDAKKAQPRKEGYYILQTDLVNERPCWFEENGGNAIWHRKDGYWNIGTKGDLRRNSLGDIISSDDVEDPSVVLNWKYYKRGDGFIKSKDILVTRPGNIKLFNLLASEILPETVG